MPLTDRLAGDSQHPKSVVLRLPGVDDDGQIQLTGERHLDVEHRLLRVLRRKVVVIVQTYLADGARALRGDPGADDRRRVGRATLESGRMVRMDANGHPDLRPEAPDLDRRSRLGRVPRPQDAHRSLHTGCPRTPDNVRQVRGKYRVREMTMAIDHRCEVTGTSGPGCQGRSPGRTRRASACHHPDSPQAPCRWTRCPSALPASG